MSAMSNGLDKYMVTFFSSDWPPSLTQLNGQQHQYRNILQNAVHSIGIQRSKEKKKTPYQSVPKIINYGITEDYKCCDLTSQEEIHQLLYCGRSNFIPEVKDHPHLWLPSARHKLGTSEPFYSLVRSVHQSHPH